MLTTIFRKQSEIVVSATGERGTVLRKVRGEDRYECEMVDGTIAYFYWYEIVTFVPDPPIDLELFEPAPAIGVDADSIISAGAETVETFSLAAVLESVISPAALRARREWELDRDSMLTELHAAERELTAIRLSESVYKLCRDRYFTNLAAAHRKIARKSSELAAHYASQPTS